MSVRAGRIKPRPTAATQTAYLSYSFPGPSQGWVSDQNLALSQPGAAYRLDNIFPTPTGGILRRGCRRHATLPSAARSMFSYTSGLSTRLLALTDTGIFDVSSTDDPVFKYPLTDGNVSTAQYTTSDDVRYVRGVNGSDVPWLYDGSSFDTSPGLTFKGDEPTVASQLSYTWVFKNRFFFIKRDTLDVFYLPVAEVGGELVKFSLGGVFPLGGKLVFGTTWSQETGDGLAAMCVFVTDQGEAAVYAGANPNDANDWRRVGIYRIGKPMGPQAFIQRGGDLAICTDIGFISLSQALLRDAESLSPTAMSAPIEPDWSRYVVERYEKRWAATAWTEGQMLAVALPTLSGQTPTWLVAHARTGKWGRFTGWDALCLANYNGALYFAAPNGNIYQANIGGVDDGKPYVGVYIPVFDQLGVAGLKTVHMSRVVMRSRFNVRERLSVHGDFRVALPPAFDAANIGAPDVWGAAKWGEGKWGGAADSTTIQDQWRNLFGGGEALTIAHQITSASIAPIDTEFIRTDVLFTAGEIQS